MKHMLQIIWILIAMIGAGCVILGVAKAITLESTVVLYESGPEGSAWNEWGVMDRSLQGDKRVAILKQKEDGSGEYYIRNIETGEFELKATMSKLEWVNK